MEGDSIQPPLDSSLPSLAHRDRVFSPLVFRCLNQTGPTMGRGMPKKHNNLVSNESLEKYALPHFLSCPQGSSLLRELDRATSNFLESCAPLFASLTHRSSFTSEWSFILVSRPRFHGMTADWTTFQWFLHLVGCTIFHLVLWCEWAKREAWLHCEQKMYMYQYLFWLTQWSPTDYSPLTHPLMCDVKWPNGQHITDINTSWHTIVRHKHTGSTQTNKQTDQIK